MILNLLNIEINPLINEGYEFCFCSQQGEIVVGFYPHKKTQLCLYGWASVKKERLVN